MKTEEIKTLIADCQARLEMLKQVLTMEDEFGEIVEQIERRGGFVGMDRKEAMRIVKVVADECGVSPVAIMARCRVGRLGTYRQIAMRMVHSRLGETLTQVGKFFNRDHGTVLFAGRAVQALCHTEPQFKLLVKRIEARLDAEQPENQTVRSAKG